MVESRSQPPLTGRSDEELFELVRDRGEREQEAGARAFDELFRRHHGAVFRWCLKILEDADLAEDVTQTVFIELWRDTKPYEARSRFKAWLYVVVRNRCFNAVRSAGRRREESLDEEIVHRFASSSTPESEYAALQLDTQLEEVCSRYLSEREQAVVHLRYGWGLRVKEITERLALTNASGARTYLRSAEEKLRRHLRGLHREWEGGT